MSLILTTLIPVMIIIAIPIFLLTVRRGRNISPFKFTNILLLVYIGVLLLSLVLVNVMGVKGLTEVVGPQRVDIYKLLYDGKRTEIDSKYLIDEKSFEFHGETLSIASIPTNQTFNFFVDRTDEEDGKINVMIYGKGLYIDQKDFSDKILPPSVNLQGERLEVGYSEFQNIKIAMVRNEFPVNQFKGKSNLSTEFDFNRPFIYIQVPENIKIAENRDILYVN